MSGDRTNRDRGGRMNKPLGRSGNYGISHTRRMMPIVSIFHALQRNLH